MLTLDEFLLLGTDLVGIEPIFCEAEKPEDTPLEDFVKMTEELFSLFLKDDITDDTLVSRMRVLEIPS